MGAAAEGGGHVRGGAVDGAAAKRGCRALAAPGGGARRSRGPRIYSEREEHRAVEKGWRADAPHSIGRVRARVCREKKKVGRLFVQP